MMQTTAAAAAAPSASPTHDSLLDVLPYSCSCLAFNEVCLVERMSDHHTNANATQVLEHVYLVGTLEGMVFRCSTAHTSSPLQAYHGHTGAVSAVRWNTVHSGVFVTAACDWTVAVWDTSISQVCLVT